MSQRSVPDVEPFSKRQSPSSPSEDSGSQPELTPHFFVTSPVVHLGILLVGFLLGVFLMVILRSELRKISALQGKMIVYMTATVAVTLFLYPFYRRLSRGLYSTFGPQKGATILFLVNFVMMGGGLVLFVLAGLYFVAVT